MLSSDSEHSLASAVPTKPQLGRQPSFIPSLARSLSSRSNLSGPAAAAVVPILEAGVIDESKEVVAATEATSDEKQEIQKAPKALPNLTQQMSSSIVAMYEPKKSPTNMDGVNEALQVDQLESIKKTLSGGVPVAPVAENKIKVQLDKLQKKLGHLPSDDEEFPLLNPNPVNYLPKSSKWKMLKTWVYLSWYQHLMLLAIFVNVYLLKRFDDGKITVDDPREFLVWNVFIALGIRMSFTRRAVFVLANMTPKWVWIDVRVVICRFCSCIGGFHSGCAISAMIWAAYLANKVQDNKQFYPDGTLELTWTVFGLFLAMGLFANPFLRRKHHNLYEVVHRFCGWSSVGVLWGLAHISDDIKDKTRFFYACLGITFFTVWPWLWVRYYPIETFVPSKFAMIIRLHGAPPAGYGRPVATNPLWEWHSFAAVSPSKYAYKSCIIVAAGGDWTKRIIAKPPKGLWVRNLWYPGFMMNVDMFDRVLIVATGAGIAPAMPYVMQKNPDHFIFWITRSPFSTYGTEMNTLIDQHPNNFVFDTDADGRPSAEEMAQMMLETFFEFKAEAVFVISNQVLTIWCVQTFQERKIPCFGATFDS